MSCHTTSDTGSPPATHRHASSGGNRGMTFASSSYDHPMTASSRDRQIPGSVPLPHHDGLCPLRRVCDGQRRGPFAAGHDDGRPAAREAAPGATHCLVARRSRGGAHGQQVRQRCPKLAVDQGGGAVSGAE